MAETLTIQKESLSHLIRQAVVEVIGDILSDPDYGLALNPASVGRLKKSVQSKKEGRVSSLEEVLRELKV